MLATLGPSSTQKKLQPGEWPRTSVDSVTRARARACFTNGVLESMLPWSLGIHTAIDQRRDWHPVDARRRNDVILRQKRRDFDVIITLLHLVSVRQCLQHHVVWKDMFLISYFGDSHLVAGFINQNQNRGINVIFSENYWFFNIQIYFAQKLTIAEFVKICWYEPKITYHINKWKYCHNDSFAIWYEVSLAVIKIDGFTY